MNVPAQMAVARVRMLPAPRPPNPCAAPPPPNAAPMPPPFPCWRRTTNMSTPQTKMWRMSRNVVNMGGGSGGRLGERVGGPGDSTERRGLQARTADKRAVDVRTRKEGAGVVGLDRTAIEDPHPFGEGGALGLEGAANGEVNLFRLGGPCVLAGTDGPNRLVRDRDRKGRSGEERDHRVDLATYDLERFLALPLLQSLADAHDGRQALSKGCCRLLGDLGVRLSEILTAFAVAEDDPRAPAVLQHRRAHFAREGTRLLGVHVLACEEYAAPLALVRRCRENGERWRDENIDARHFPRELRALSCEREARRAALVHLPVARNERSSS